MNTYLDKLASYYDRRKSYDRYDDYDDYGNDYYRDPRLEKLLTRLETVEEGNSNLAKRGRQPILQETAADELKAKDINNAIRETKIRPNQSSASGFGILGGLGGGIGGAAVGGIVGSSMSRGKYAPIGALIGGGLGAVGGGFGAYHAYYNDDRRYQDDQHIQNANAYLDKILSKYPKIH